MDLSIIQEESELTGTTDGLSPRAPRASAGSEVDETTPESEESMRNSEETDQRSDRSSLHEITELSSSRRKLVVNTSVDIPSLLKSSEDELSIVTKHLMVSFSVNGQPVSISAELNFQLNHAKNPNVSIMPTRVEFDEEEIFDSLSEARSVSSSTSLTKLMPAIKDSMELYTKNVSLS